MKIQLGHKFEDIISLDNLLAAWQGFLPGKRKKQDVQEFHLNLADNILQLHQELANFTYEQGGYYAFNISDPKPRNIHKAQVRDRVLHHAIYRQLYPFFDRTFIADSFSCRVGKGVHRALDRFREFGLRVGKNNTRTVWVLKLDIKKFFASIEHEALLQILKNYIPDENIMRLLENVIESFSIRTITSPTPSSRGGEKTGLPLGNLTSQLFCNVYMNELDQFVKHKLKAKYYIRYADDFVLFSEDKAWLLEMQSKVSKFLNERLRLSLHPDKIVLKTLASGVDFLGWVHFPKYRTVRSATRRRMFRRILQHPTEETRQSYLGLLKHGQAFKLRLEVADF